MGEWSVALCAWSGVATDAGLKVSERVRSMDVGRAAVERDSGEGDVRGDVLSSI
jgi:hypothetical protein